MSELGIRLARGEPTAFAELYDQCADRCHHYLTLLLGSRDAADETLQETFVRLVRKRGKFAAVENPVAYVFTVARNEGLRHASRLQRERQRMAPLSSLDLFAVADDSAKREAVQTVAEGLQRLSLELREVVELKVYGGLTFREIGQITEVPLQTAATRYRAALEQLKEWFARQPS